MLRAAKKWSIPQRGVRGYFLAVAAVSIATVAQWRLDPVVGAQFPYVTFFFAVVITAWLAGTRPAMLAMAAGIAGAFLFLEPNWSVAIRGRDNYIGAVIYLLLSTTVTLLIDLLRRVSDELRAANARLRRTVDELRAAEMTRRELAAIVEHSEDAIIGKRLDGTITSWNRGAERIYGYSVEQAIGKHISMLCLPDRLEEVDLLLSKLKRGESIHHFQTTRVRLDGSRIDVDVSISPIKNDEGEITGVSSIARDITALKRAEENLQRLNQRLEKTVAERTAGLQAANKELEAFSYTVSHDLRAPLRHIAGFVELLRKHADGRLDARSGRYLTTIAEATERAGRMVDELLAFSHMNRSDLNRQAVNMNQLVRDVRQDPVIGGNQCEVNWIIADLPTVEGDPRLLRLVLINLFSNALKFTAKRTRPEIAIDAECREDKAVFSVRDNGAGFDMQYAGKLFGVFQRLHRREHFDGTGIGLANVRRIIQRHGGRTWAEGEIDVGATFYFSLPTYQQNSEQAHEANSAG